MRSWVGQGASVQDAVLGDILPDLARRRGGAGAYDTGQHGARRLGSPTRRLAKAYVGNAQRVPQSVVKRVAQGGTHTRAELKCQLAYVTREDGVRATWTNQTGVEREIGARTIPRTVETWTASWRGAPKRGHTDHIILSFPRGTDAEQAEAIARDWGKAVFMSGDFGDRWRYVAGLHQDTDHVHAHFVVDKRGVDEGRFLSISNKAELTYGVMRELHAEIAGEHGLALAATSRRSRGHVENVPREVEYRAAHADGREPRVAPLGTVARMRREAEIRAFARAYRDLGASAGLLAGGDRTFMDRLAGMLTAASDALEEGVALMASSGTTTETGQRGRLPFEPSERLAQAIEDMTAKARTAWDQVQDMEPGADKTALEARFAAQAREVTAMPLADPWLRAHAEAAERSEDPYAHPRIAALHASRDAAPEGSEFVRRIERALDGISERLEARLGEDRERLAAFETNPEEVAARHMLPERSVAQLSAWRDQSNTVETVAWLEEERRTSRQAQEVVAAYALPRELEEDLAKDQLARADAGRRLSEIPAVEALVRRVGRDLDPEDREAALGGDTSALSKQVTDPTLRAVVASELRHGAATGVEPERARASDAVDDYQSMARQADLRAGADPRTRDRSRAAGAERDVADDYGL